MLLLIVSQVDLLSFQIPTAMSDSKSFNTSLLEVMISSKNEHVFICDLSNLILHITFEAWWASMNVGSKHPIAWNHSRHAPLWQFYLHYRQKDNGSASIICIICHQVLRHPSKHETSSMGKQLLAKSHIAKLDNLTELEATQLTISMVDETALAILKRQGSRGITIGSLQIKFIYHIWDLSILTELTEKTLQTGSEGLSNCRNSPRHRQWLRHDTICCGAHYMECYIKPRAMMVIQCIKMHVRATVRKYTE